MTVLETKKDARKRLRQQLLELGKQRKELLEQVSELEYRADALLTQWAELLDAKDWDVIEPDEAYTPEGKRQLEMISRHKYHKDEHNHDML